MHLVFRGAFYPPTDPTLTQAFTFSFMSSPMSGSVSGFWSHCLNHFERELSAQQFATWFRVLSAEETDSSITVVAPNAFCQQMGARSLPEHDRFARDSLLSGATHRSPAAVPALRSAATRKLLNALHRQSSRHQPVHPSPPGQCRKRPVVTAATVAAARSPAQRHANQHSTPSFTFDSFVTGKANQLARAAAMQVAGNPG